MSKRSGPTGAAAMVSFVVALVATLAAGCGGGGDQAEPTSSPPAAEASLTDLASVDEFAVLFNEKRGVPRLVLLLSPT